MRGHGPQRTVFPTLGLWHAVEQGGPSCGRVKLNPSVGLYVAQYPTNREANHVATQPVPRRPLASEVGGRNRFGQGLAVEQGVQRLG